MQDQNINRQENLQKSELITFNLSPNQEAAIFALLESRTIGQAAKKAGVSTRTFYNYMQDGNFQAALNFLQSSVLGSVTVRLLGLQSSVLDQLEHLMNDSHDERIKLLASQSIMDYYVKFLELGQVSGRLNKLEKLAEGQNGQKSNWQD